MLELVYWGNSVRSYVVAAGVLLAILIAVRITRYVLVKRVGQIARRTATHLDDTVVGMVRATRTWLAAFVALYAASLFLILPPELSAKVRTAAIVALLVQIGVWAMAAIASTVQRLREKKLSEGDTAGIGILAMIGFFGRVLAWAVLALLILDNLGVDVTALVTGLGIGGVALALAVQNVLQDLFASVSIMLDRPFEIGDTIKVDGFIGTVEHIGIKTTRIRSLEGEELVFANADLLKSRIRNYRRMQQRRVVFTVGVAYDTPMELLESLPGLLRDLIEPEEKVRFDRAHLKTLGQSSLDFEMVYYVTAPEYLVYMDIVHRFNLSVLARLRALGVSIAYPTQTLHIQPAAPPPGAPAGRPPAA